MDNCFGYEPDPPSEDDYDFSTLAVPRDLYLTPHSGDVDLREYASPIQHQGSTNSCVAQSVVSAFELQRIRAYGRESHVDLSRLQLYFYMRELRGGGKEYENVGGYIRHAIYAMNKFGIVPESLFPWDANNWKERPPLQLLVTAAKHRAGSYYRISSKGSDRVEECIKALNAGYAIAYGTDVDKTWRTYRGSGTSKPLTVADTRLGGHATLIVGYTGSKFIGQNSWGTGWGLSGFYEATPELIASRRSRDFWVVTRP